MTEEIIIMGSINQDVFITTNEFLTMEILYG